MSWNEQLRWASNFTLAAEPGVWPSERPLLKRNQGREFPKILTVAAGRGEGPLVSPVVGERDGVHEVRHHEVERARGFDPVLRVGQLAWKKTHPDSNVKQSRQASLSTETDYPPSLKTKQSQRGENFVFSVRSCWPPKHNLRPTASAVLMPLFVAHVWRSKKNIELETNGFTKQLVKSVIRIRPVE